MNKSAIACLKLMRSIFSESIWHLGSGEEMFLVSEFKVVDPTKNYRHRFLIHPQGKARSAKP